MKTILYPPPFWILTLLLFLGTMLPYNASAQVTCCPFTSCLPNYPEDPWIVCGPYDNLPGPYFVRVYLYFIVTGDPGDYDESLKDRAVRIWTNLEEDFDEHQIFFIPGFGDCRDPGTTYFTIESQLTASDIIDLRGGDVQYSRDDGLCIYVFPDNLNKNTGSGCIPSNFCYLQGATSPSDGPDSKLKVVSHEVGHCLGLVHTYHGKHDGNVGDGCLDEDGSNCWQEGDYVCDTPPDDKNYNNSDSDCDPDPDPDMDYLNLMSAFAPAVCKDHFSAGQGARMRHYLGNHIGLMAQIQAVTRINSAVTWNTARYATGNIIVETGGSLTLNAPVYMPEGTYIYVERGGTLTVRNTITGACDKMWQGIIVDGNDSPLLGQNTTDQGVVYLAPAAVIEHARCGVRLQGWYDPGIYEAARTGGMLRASAYATFRNNTTGVWFEKYPLPTGSYLQNCKFTVTDDYRGNPSDKIVHLKMHGLYNLRVGGNFLDERTGQFESPITRATGIDAYDAAFSIRPNFSACHFENLYEGIHISKVNEYAGSCHVEGAGFEKCFTGIYSNFHNNFYFGGNTFYLFRPDNFTGEAPETLTGILLDGMNDGFMLTENDFSSTLEYNLDQPIGCDAVAISTANNRIFKNNFEYLYYGNRAGGINAAENSLGGQVATYSGLWYECNVNTENILDPDLFVKRDFYVLSNGKIRYVQGRLDQFNNKIATGNIFTDPASWYGTFNNLGAPIFYHYYPLDPDQEPYSPTGITLQEADQENTDCGNEECPPPCDTETELNTRKAQFFQTRQGWSDRLAELPGISNPQKRQTLADTVNFQRAMLDREGGLILCNYTLDTTGRKIDSILVWLGHMQTYESDLRLMLHYFFTRDFSGESAMSTAILANYDLGEAAETDFADIRDILETIRDVVDEEAPLESLPEDILDTLEINWGTDCSQAGALARNLLHRNGRDLLPDCSVSPRPASSNKALTVLPDAIRIYPNPADREVLIDCSTVSDDAILVLTNLSSGKIAWQLAPRSAPSVRADTGQMSAGVYLLTVLAPNRPAVHERLLIIH